MKPEIKQPITIIYDGDCPVCNAYIRYTRLQPYLSPELINARTNSDIIGNLEYRGLEINKGMVVIFSDRYYHGAEAMHLLSTLTTKYGFVNRINIFFFLNPGCKPGIKIS